MTDLEHGAALRPMALDDIDGAQSLAEAAFADLSLRRGPGTCDPEVPWPSPFRGRWRHLLAADPDGCWVAEDADGLAGVSVGLRRGAVWGLSMLAVRVGVQSRGIGRALLERALRTAEGAEAALIVASDDPRAIRRYALAGFALRPTLSATGAVHPERLPDHHGTRLGDPTDLDLTEAVDIRVRGAARGADLATVLVAGGRLVVADGPRRGFPRIRRSLSSAGGEVSRRPYALEWTATADHLPQRRRGRPGDHAGDRASFKRLPPTGVGRFRLPDYR